MVQPTEEKVSLVFAAATLATVEGPLEPPVVHHLAVHAQLQTDALISSDIPAERTGEICPDSKLVQSRFRCC